MVLIKYQEYKIKKKAAEEEFMPKWVSPFKALQLAGPVAAKLELPPVWKTHPVFHVSLLKPYYSNGTVQPPQPLDYIDGDPVYKVDKLLYVRIAKNGKRRETQYLIRWDGLGPEHDTWEPCHNISDDLIHDYKQSARTHPT